jgi:hypothetical protein
MFNKLRNTFAVLGFLAFLAFVGYYSFVTYQQARAGAAVYVWLNSSPAKGQPLRLETLEKLINAPNP